jgi:hypothetical protein
MEKTGITQVGIEGAGEVGAAKEQAAAATQGRGMPRGEGVGISTAEGDIKLPTCEVTVVAGGAEGYLQPRGGAQASQQLLSGVSPEVCLCGRLL